MRKTSKSCFKSLNGTSVNKGSKLHRSLLMPSPSKLGPTDDSRLMLPPFAKTLEPLRIVIVFDCVSYPTEPLQPLLRCLDLRLLVAFLTHGDLRGCIGSLRVEVLVLLHVGSIEAVSRMKQIYMSFAYDYASTLCIISSSVIHKERDTI